MTFLTHNFHNYHKLTSVMKRISVSAQRLRLSWGQGQPSCSHHLLNQDHIKQRQERLHVCRCHLGINPTLISIVLSTNPAQTQRESGYLFLSEGRNRSGRDDAPSPRVNNLLPCLLSEAFSLAMTCDSLITVSFFTLFFGYLFCI